MNSFSTADTSTSNYQSKSISEPNNNHMPEQQNLLQEFTSEKDMSKLKDILKQTLDMMAYYDNLYNKPDEFVKTTCHYNMIRGNDPSELETLTCIDEHVTFKDFKLIVLCGIYFRKFDPNSIPKDTVDDVRQYIENFTLNKDKKYRRFLHIKTVEFVNQTTIGDIQFKLIPKIYYSMTSENMEFLTILVNFLLEMIAQRKSDEHIKAAQKVKENPDYVDEEVVQK